MRMRYWYVWVQRTGAHWVEGICYYTTPQDEGSTLLCLEPFVPDVRGQIAAGTWWPACLSPIDIAALRPLEGLELLPVYGLEDQLVALLLRREHDTRE